MKEPIDKIITLVRAIFFLCLLLVGFGVFLVLAHINPHLFVIEPDPEPAAWKLKSVETDLEGVQNADEIRYGYELIINTPKIIGPLAPTEDMRFAGNNLTCNNCHLQGGRKIGSGSFIGVMNRFPQFRGRENKMGTMEERINGCMQRSMNGNALEENSREMQAMIAYMQWLSEDVPEEIENQYKGYRSIEIPNERADTAQGRILYEIRCSPCHLSDGSGMKNPGPTFTGYLYPPLGGSDTYNDGAGMNRVITAAEFIKYNMPFGVTYDAPILTDEEAYHIAAYINSFDRPSKANREADFPDRKLKPVSTPYGPWADEFPAHQHKYGPFPPIIDFYEEKYGITKSK